MKLTLSRKSIDSVTISYKINIDGKIIEDSSTFKKEKHYEEAFSKYPKYFEAIKAFVRLFRDSENTTDSVELSEAVKKVTYTIKLRELLKPEEQATIIQDENPVEAFDKALKTNIATPHLIEWKDRDSICALDIDYHDNPSYFDDVRLLLKLVTPSPRFSWVTKSKGLRLVYFRDETTTAYEYAVLAMLCIKHHDTRCSVEFKSDTWHPTSIIDGKACSEVISSSQTYDDGILSEYMGTYTVDSNKIDDYLVEKGLEIGQRYPHTHCPINPSKGDKRNPVTITPRGIYCYVCNAEDRYYDGVKKTPGFVPYGLLLKGSYVGLVNDCIANFTHFTHAKYVLRSAINVDMKDEQLEVLYRLLLRKRHLDKDEIIAGCFNKSLNFVRVDKDWRTETNEPCQFADSSASLKALPVTWYRDDEGKLKADSILVERMTKPHDLSRVGYLDLQPVIGLSLYHTFNTDPNPLRIPFVYQINELSNDIYKDRLPRYVEKKDRKITPAKAYKLVSDMFSGLDMRIIKLLIAVRGLSEVTDGHGNFIFIRGASGSGKTAVVQIAASILGDNALEVSWLPDADDLRRRIAESKAKASFVLFNEVIKAGKRTKDKQPASLRFLLNVTPRETYHKLYYGPTQIGRLPVIVLTDTDIPISLMVDRQIGRRVIYIEIFGWKTWEDSLRKHGMTGFHDIRLVDESYAHACNVIVSDIIDSYFLNKTVSYKKLVSDLGFCYMNETEAAKQGEKALVKFYRQWLVEKPVAADYHSKWFETHGPGWRIIDFTRPENELTEQWFDLADGIEDYDRFRSERITEAPWNLILETTKNVKCILEKKSASELAILFAEEKEGRKLEAMKG